LRVKQEEKEYLGSKWRIGNSRRHRHHNLYQKLQSGPNQRYYFHLYTSWHIETNISVCNPNKRKSSFFEIVKVFLKAPNWLSQKHSNTEQV